MNNTDITNLYNQKLFEELTKIDPKLGKIYSSATFVLIQSDNIQSEILENPIDESISNKKNFKNDKNLFSKNFKENSDKIAQSAHSIRETVNVLSRHLDILPPHVKKEQNIEQKTKLKMKFQMISDPQSKQPNPHQYLFKKIVTLHKWFTNVSHHGSYPSEKEYLEKLDDFTSLMLHILASHYETIENIDKLLVKSTPEKNDLEKLENLISKDNSSYRYFFNHAKSDWLDILIADGKYFKNIPNVIKEDDSFLHQYWPESYYLEQIAAEKPEQVQKLISDICISKDKSKQNHRVLENFIKAAIKMPPKFGKIIAKKAIKEKWYGFSHISTLPMYLVDLVMKLKEDEFEISLKLCNFLLDLELVYFKTHNIAAPDLIDFKTYNIAAPDLIDFKTYNITAPDLIDFKTYNITAPDLIDFKTYNITDLGIPQRKANSVIDNYGYEEILKKNIPSLLEQDSDAVTQMLCKKLSKANTLHNKARQKSNQDLNQDYSAVWRPAIEDHEQNRNYDLRSHLVVSIRIALEKSESTSIQKLKKSLNLLAKYNYHIFHRLELYFYGRHPTEFNDEINLLTIKYFDNYNFIHEYYHMLKNSYPQLSSENQQKLLDIIAKGPTYNDFIGKDKFETYKKHWRMVKLSPIIKYLPDLQEEYNSLVKQSGENNFMDFARYHSSPSKMTYSSDLSNEMTVEQVLNYIKSYGKHQGFFIEEDQNAQVFADLIEKNPNEYLKHVPELLECPELFHFRFLEGLSKVKNKELDWDAILSFLEHVIIEFPSKEHQILDRILYYGSKLLENHLVSKSPRIPFIMRNRVWKILEKAIEIAPSDASWSDNYPEKSFDAYGISINTSVGTITYAIIQYSVWCYYELKTPHFTPAELEPEVKKIFDSLLAHKQDQSISFHAALGFRFSRLLGIDEKWTKSKINFIFTHDEQHEKAGDAAWDAYLYDQMYIDSFNALFDECVYRITCFKKNMLEKLSQYVALSYLHSLEQSDKLLETLLKKDCSQLLDECIAYIGRQLQSWKYEKSPKMDISKFLSYPEINSNSNTGWLFLNPLMDEQKRISLLESILDKTDGKISPLFQIAKELEIFAKKYPLETLECVEKMLKHDDAKSYLIHHIDKILQSIEQKDDDSITEKMNQIVNFLGSLGYDGFRRFLRKK